MSKKRYNKNYKYDEKLIYFFDKNKKIQLF